MIEIYLAAVAAHRSAGRLRTPWCVRRADLLRLIAGAAAIVAGVAVLSAGGSEDASRPADRAAQSVNRL